MLLLVKAKIFRLTLTFVSRKILIPRLLAAVAKRLTGRNMADGEFVRWGKILAPASRAKREPWRQATAAGGSIAGDPSSIADLSARHTQWPKSDNFPEQPPLKGALGGSRRIRLGRLEDVLQEEADGAILS